MADKDEHLKQAHHNEEFLEYLRENISIYADWYTICIYYTALHYIEAYLDILFQHPTNNFERDRDIKQYLDKSTRKKFRLLKDVSENARYNIIDINVEGIDKEFEPALEFIKNNINELINSHM